MGEVPYAPDTGAYGKALTLLELSKVHKEFDWYGGVLTLESACSITCFMFKKKL